ncbi:hypothetical protein Pan216_54800 [Planctomycetes bacterium Pan216]|uniref:Uncharacterized protein n=1 Tax=Kolteria novifilia TaxID=2527975 RepID=A0A518BC73_9BACT|nr:hypothetical protein Pan216_54800 [Planctomycetes bacterium Pan216]
MTDEGGARQSTITVPGKIPFAGLGQEATQIDLCRNFNWVAQLHEDESLVLYVDRTLGGPRVLINGESLGHVSSPWGTSRFEISRLVRTSNKLVLTWDRQGLEEEVGVIGGIWLAVESRLIEIEEVDLQTQLEDSLGAVNVSFDCEARGDIALSLLLDGRTIAQHRAVAGDVRGVTMTADSLEIDPWMPRSLGLPTRHELTLQARTPQRVVWERRWEVGFRAIVGVGDAAYRCNGRSLKPKWDTIDATRLERIALGEAITTLVDQAWLERFDGIIVSGVLVPEELLAFCDRVGLLLRRELPPETRMNARSTTALRARHRWHPCWVEGDETT